MSQTFYALMDRYSSGINQISDLNKEDTSYMRRFDSLSDLLLTRFETDAHFVIYRVSGADNIPRINKSALRGIRDAGMDVLVHSLVIDYDNSSASGEHAGWTPESLQEFSRAFEDKCDDLMSRWSAFYTTRGGVRILYKLSEPIPCDDAELLIRGLITRYRTLGIKVDNLIDWTRLFRAPDVRRDGVQQGDQWWFICAQQENTLNPDEVPKVGSLASMTDIIPFDSERPSEDDACNLLWTENNGRRVTIQWYRIAKRALAGRSCYGCIFEDKLIAEDGQRNQTLISYTGSAVSLLYRYPDTTPELIFALFVPAVQQLEGSDGNRAWIDTLWHGIKLAWEREEGNRRLEQEKLEEVKEFVLDGKERLIAGVREWNPALVKDADAAWAWISSRQIIAAPSKYFVMRSDGWYHGTPCGKDMLPATIHRLEMERLVDGFLSSIYDKDGNEIGEKTCSLATLLEDHAFAVHGVRGRSNMKGGVLYIDQTGQTFLDLSMYCLRTDIKPKYNEDVDSWLHACFGERTIEVENWIGHSLDFSRPIAALSIVGPPGMGKKMLSMGLAGCVNTRCIAQGEEMVDQYQSAIAKTPFVNINEGFPSQNYGRSAADNFRRWTSGDPITVNPKFMPTLEIQSPLRILITANNSDVVRTLSQGKTLSIEDRDAIGMRLLHIQAEETCAHWLRMKGGLNFTKGWIDADDGSPGQDCVAKHFLWLYKNRKPIPDGNRFLVEGGLDSDVIQDMALESGIMPDVVETIIDLISSGHSNDTAGLNVNEDTGKICVLANAVVQHHAKIARRGAKALTHRPVAQALRTLKHSLWPEGNHRIEDAGGKLKQARWWMLDNSMLLRAARTSGFRTDKITSLMMKEDDYVEE